MGENTIKSWYENNNIDLSLDRIKHIASANNWLERLQNYRIYNEQVNLLKRRYKLDICSNNTLDTLINCINNCGGLISDKLENYDGNYNEIKQLTSSLNEQVKLARLISGLNESSLLFDGVVNHNNEINSIEAIYNEIEEAMDQLDNEADSK